MACKHPSVTREPTGNLCVIREDGLTGWSVLICPGVTGSRKPLARFGTRSEAEDFAKAEMLRLNSTGTSRFVLHVDDCPCWQKQL